MSDEVVDEVAGSLLETSGSAMDVVDSIQDEMSSESASLECPCPAKSGLSIAPVRMTSEVGEDGQKKVPGIKIIGLSSELKKSMNGEDSKDTSIEDDDEEEDEEDDDVEEEEEEEESDEDDEEEEEDDDENEADEPPAKIVKTPKVTIRKVAHVSTPGGSNETTPKKMPFAGAGVMSSGKKRGRPSRADLAVREKERQEAMARGEPDPELKRKRRKPIKLNDADSEEELKEERKRRKREEKEERKKARRNDDTEDTDNDEKPKKKGRRKKILTAEEEKARDEERKRKYKELRDKQKEKAERRKNYLIQKREERKAKKAEEKIKQEEHNKRMAELRSQYLDDNATDLPADSSFLLDENSQNSNSFVKKRKAWGDVGQAEGAGIYNPLAHVTAETLFEYKWPLEGRHSEHYFLQEQVTEFMGVKSFKRKYPDCPRRTINMEERDFLIEMKIVNETQADLGLTAIPSAYVLDIMCAEFYEKYEEYTAVVNERKERSLRNQNYTSGSGNVKIDEAVKAAAEFNKKFNEERRNQRKAYFDMQTFTCQYPKDNKGRMKVLKKPAPGSYPVAMIPGQFVDHYKSYSGKELKLFPLNTATSATPGQGLTTRDLNLGSDGSESESGTSDSSDSSSGESDSESGTDKDTTRNKKKKAIKAVVKPEVKVRRVDEVRPLATCKHCNGNINQNKIGVPELLLHCSKCNQSSHPTCVGLSLELLSYVTSYDWECTDCKKCVTCLKAEDEDKMLFCDLCDRGYHIYCVGLSEIPSGRWHCGSCASCVSCETKVPWGDGVRDESLDWIFETKIDSVGNKVYSHTMCHICHKMWKKGNFCPECNGVFGRKNKGQGILVDCWICTRTHFAKCVGLEGPNERFICGACQKKTLERTIIGGKKEEPRAAATPASSFSRTPVTASYSRSGRRVTQINFANQF